MSLLATIAGGLFGAMGQSSANRANLSIARENRAWQERMSNTAYQRAATDLQKAGLNRILALGSPASTPGGNVATMGNVGAAGVNSAMQAAQLKAAVNQAQLTKEQSLKTKYENVARRLKAEAMLLAERKVKTTAKDVSSGAKTFPYLQEIFTGKGEAIEPKAHDYYVRPNKKLTAWENTVKWTEAYEERHKRPPNENEVRSYYNSLVKAGYYVP